MSSAFAKVRALEAKVLAVREENRRRFPTAARMMAQFKAFSPTVVEARDGENYVVNSKVIKPTDRYVVPFVWTEHWARQAKMEAGKG